MGTTVRHGPYCCLVQAHVRRQCKAGKVARTHVGCTRSYQCGCMYNFQTRCKVGAKLGRCLDQRERETSAHLVLLVFCCPRTAGCVCILPSASLAGTMSPTYVGIYIRQHQQAATPTTPSCHTGQVADASASEKEVGLPRSSVQTPGH